MFVCLLVSWLVGREATRAHKVHVLADVPRAEHKVPGEEEVLRELLQDGVEGARVGPREDLVARDLLGAGVPIRMPSTNARGQKSSRESFANTLPDTPGTACEGAPRWGSSPVFVRFHFDSDGLNKTPRKARRGFAARSDPTRGVG